MSFSDLVERAAKLDVDEFEKFVVTVNKLRAKQRPEAPSQKELDLLEKINSGFPVEKWQQMQHLDAKMESSMLTEEEYAELTSLTDAYEKYCVQRIRLLKRLALLRNISLEVAMEQIGLEHGKV